MIFSKANLLVSGVASKDEYDRSLHGVRLEPDGSTVAGNGRIVMAVAPVNKEKADFPENIGEEMNVGDQGILLSVDAVDKTIKNMSKDKRGYQYIGMMKVADPVRIGLTTVDEKGNSNTYASLPKRDVFPPWKEKLKKLGGNVRVCINRRDLIELLKALDSACPDKGKVNPLFIELDPEGKGLLMRCVNYDTGQTAIGGVAKYDTKGQWLQKSDWEESIFDSLFPRKRRKPKRRKK